jgi:GNAT superfamily N-acetyltransferase
VQVGAVRSPNEIADAAKLMRGLVDANKALYSDDLATIEEYYLGSWFFDEKPNVPCEYRPPRGDVLVAYLEGVAVGAVAIYRMDDVHCELKSMFVASEYRKNGVAAALCDAVITLAKTQSYRFVRLTTGLRQLAARRLYEKLGFMMVTPWVSDPPEGYDYFELDIPQD